MKKLFQIFTASTLVLAAFLPATTNAAVTPGSVTSLLTSQAYLKASSAQTPLFSFTLAQTAGETLSSVAVRVNILGSSTASSGDFTAVNVYKDNGNASFDPLTDLLAGTQTTVNVGSDTVVTTASNNVIDGGKFFVSFATSSTWSSSSSPVDSVSVTLPANSIVTSANSPTISATTTANITADTVGPVLSTAIAKNTGGGSAKNAGDTVELTFGEATNKPSITSANINSILVLNNSHTWVDGVTSIGGAVWNSAGTMLTITLSAGTSIPTIALGDTLTVTGTAISDSLGNFATGTKVLTGTFGEDVTGPTLTTATALDGGGTAAKEAGDKIELNFNEGTNKPSITAANVASVLQLNNSHSFLDGAGALGTTSWNSDGKKLTLTLTAGTSLPTVAIGDTVTILTGTIKDSTGNNATGSATITGDFGTQGQGQGGKHDDDDDEDNDEDSRKVCPAGLINDRLYKVKDSTTVYLVAGCHLKPFRGNAVFKARGHKFQDITTLNTLPADAHVSDKPALPAEGTLVKGDKDKTVWFVSRDGHRHGFTKKEIFEKLGFAFDKVEIISQSDLDTMTVGDNVDREDKHPDGSIIKCQHATVVFKINAGKKEAFTSAEAFNAKGHQFKHILSVDCSKFTYQDGTPIQ